jgi:hypothetical protein
MRASNNMVAISFGSATMRAQEVVGTAVPSEEFFANRESVIQVFDQPNLFVGCGVPEGIVGTRPIGFRGCVRNAEFLLPEEPSWAFIDQVEGFGIGPGGDTVFSVP